MREYLFRGKHSQCDEWLIGFYYEDRRKNPKILIDDPYLGLRECFVIPETVGQFTGLYDKNGVRIFEGDIVDIAITICAYENDPDPVYRTITGKVEYSSGNFWFIGSGYSINNWFHYNSSDIKVIGNIHDNPELLNIET